MLCVFDMVLFQNFLLKRLSNTFNFFCVCPPLTKATTTTGSIKIKNQTLCGKKEKNNVKIIKEIKWELLFKSFASYLNPFDKTCPPPPFFTLKNIWKLLRNMCVFLGWVFLKRGDLPWLMAHALLLVEGFKLFMLVYVWFQFLVAFYHIANGQLVAFFVVNGTRFNLQRSYGKKQTLQSSLGQELMKLHACRNSNFDASYGGRVSI